MKIWVIQAQENLPNKKTELSSKEWRSNRLSSILASAGHKVIRWRSSFDHIHKRQISEKEIQEIEQDFKMQILKARSYKNNIGLGRFLSHQDLAKEFLKHSSFYSEKPDLIHISSVPIELCEKVIEYGLVNNVKVIVDIRDLWPDIILEMIPKFLFFARPLVKLGLGGYFSKTRYIFRNATALSALTSSMLKWGLNRGSREITDLDFVFPMSPNSNNVNIDVKKVDSFYSRYSIKNNEMIICFAGTLGHQFDFNTVISAAKKLERENQNLRFIIAGKGPMLKRLRNLSRRVESIDFIGWVDGDDLEILYKISNFGLMPYKNFLNFRLNLPNKFSEYLKADLPIITNLTGEIDRFVEYKCAERYIDGNPDDLARIIKKLINDKDAYNRMKISIRKIYSAEFNSNSIYKKALENIEKFNGF